MCFQYRLIQKKIVINAEENYIFLNEMSNMCILVASFRSHKSASVLCYEVLIKVQLYEIGHCGVLLYRRSE